MISGMNMGLTESSELGGSRQPSNPFDVINQFTRMSEIPNRPVISQVNPGGSRKNPELIQLCTRLILAPVARPYPIRREAQNGSGCGSFSEIPMKKKL